MKPDAKIATITLNRPERHNALVQPLLDELRDAGRSAAPPTVYRALDFLLEQGLVLLGLTGMMDPLREDVKGAVTTCIDAGIRPVMITGDHPATADAIAVVNAVVGRPCRCEMPDHGRANAG